MIIGSGVCYFTIDYCNGFRAKLPEIFTGPLDVKGCGSLTVRYGGKTYVVNIRNREFRDGWKKFVLDSHLVTGNIILASYSGGDTISLMRFKKGIGMNAVWENIIDPYDVDSKLVSEANLPHDYSAVDLSVPYLSGYYPTYMAYLFGASSGVCLFTPGSELALEIPLNLAQGMNLASKTTVNIRSGQITFENVETELGFFRGDVWAHLVQACALTVGFKLFFFLNDDGDYEMIVIGFGNCEVLYDWSRTYFKLV